MRLFYSFLLSAFIAGTTANSQTASRLVAYSIRDYENGTSFELTDTTHFNFSGYRGGDLTQPMKYDSSHAWKYISTILTDDRKVYQTFDVNDNMLTYLQQQWDIGTAVWQDDIMNIYTYDVNDLVSQQVNITWNTGTNVWDSTSKTTYSYDVDGNLLIRTKQTWNNGTNSWENSEKDTYSYTIDGMASSHTYETWNGTTWDNITRKSWAYTNGDVTLYLEEQWSITNNIWENYLQLISTYDTDHHLLTRTTQSWISGAWQNDYLKTNTYTGDDLTMSEDQSWNSGTSSWQNSSRGIFTYDADHNLIEDISQVWNGFSDYDNLTRFQKEYNTYNQLTYQLSENWDGTSWTPFLFDRIYSYYYEEYTTAPVSASAGMKNSGIKLFPNPGTDRFTILSADVIDGHIRILNELGQVVRTKNISGHREVIDMSAMSPGIYFIEVRGEKAHFNTTFIRQ